MNFDICKKCVNVSEALVIQEKNDIATVLVDEGKIKKCSFSGKLGYSRNVRKRVFFNGCVAICEHSNDDGSFKKFTLSKTKDFEKLVSKMNVPSHCKFFVEQTVKDLYK